ncbi:hydantoinase/oxoprolinase family protein [Glaciecola petra]|uniref:Hydantoinase/oxoprolinase family protein n=1 Tax=Glaciecola petra TaxID=3075602 RepID=A0ABU2ZUL8_9ALTE|nr:hydantoinase/oxoprolinase family protein [Aestuariibacter sp. P117]MDT0596342.1 hydantoinase/oxoprolinase family protein [Aestuariibacter sp. P117]
MRIGIDVGGTHTDAVLINHDQILSHNKSLTTADVTTGVQNAIDKLLQDSLINADQIEAVMIGTTQFTNSVVERKNLSKVAAIRIALPSGQELKPMADWPSDIASVIGENIYMLDGGFLYDGSPIAPTNSEQIRLMIDSLLSKKITSIAISSAFSPMNPEPEIALGKQIQTAIPEANITLSHKIGSLGILERENAAILNASLLEFANKVVEAFIEALAKRNIKCPMYISQNDGTLMSADFVRQFPALTFASGPTNSLRGASKLSGLQDAIVVDIGGTTSDIGVLNNGFPRESNNIIKVGGVRTNFRMPDIQAVALGGGTCIDLLSSSNELRIGPHSVGHRLVEDGLIFGGNTLTASDIAVAAGLSDMGNKKNVSHLPSDIVQKALLQMTQLLDDNIDMMKPNSEPMPVILVGGGSILVSGNIKAASSILRPDYAGVANAIGAAIAQIGGESESMLSYRQIPRDQAITQVTQQASDQAIKAGANPSSIKVTDIEETAIPYMDEGMTKIRVKVVGDIGKCFEGNTDDL